jgi:hypothetical protein
MRKAAFITPCGMRNNACGTAQSEREREREREREE